MRKKIVAGNWKMNCDREQAFSLATEIKGMLADEMIQNVQIILAPPFVHVAGLAHLMSDTEVKIAGQNCASESSGAFTGEVSASMLHSVGVTAVLVGHSERRTYFAETSEILLKKTHLALQNNLIPIFCIGESLSERESDIHFKIIQSQLDETVFLLSADDFAKVIIAYEPVWAIGTGRTASAGQAQEMHAYIRKAIKNKFGSTIAENTSILYGGSCNESNAKELFSLEDVDGGLIGGASLKSRSFVNIAKSF